MFDMEAQTANQDIAIGCHDGNVLELNVFWFNDLSSTSKD